MGTILPRIFQRREIDATKIHSKKVPTSVPDQVLKRLNAVSRDDFYLFNETSVNHLRIAASGANGPEVKTRAEQILTEYEQWQQQPFSLAPNNEANIGDDILAYYTPSVMAKIAAGDAELNERLVNDLSRSDYDANDLKDAIQAYIGGARPVFYPPLPKPEPNRYQTLYQTLYSGNATVRQYLFQSAVQSAVQTPVQKSKAKRIFNSTNECSICLTNNAVVVLHPCGHKCMCEECAPKYTRTDCPLCRGVIESKTASSR